MSTQKTEQGQSAGMNIHSLRLEHFAGIPQLQLNLGSTGVTVVHGRNESGKSTVLKALMLLLDTRVNTKTTRKDVLSLVPIDGSGKPSIEAEMTIGDYHLNIIKRYGTGKHSAQLTVHSPRVENLLDREAEDRFAEILNESIDRSLLDALTIEQGESLNSFAAGQIQSLSSVLGANAEENEGEQSPGSEWEQQEADSTAAELMAAVEAEYDRYFTKAGNSKRTGELYAAETGLTEAQEALDEATDTYEKAQSLISSIASAEDDHSRIEGEIPKARRDVQLLEEKLEAAQERARGIERLEQQVEAARKQQQLGQYQSDARREQAEAVATLKSSLEKAQKQLARLSERAAETRREISALDADKGFAQQQRELGRSFFNWAQRSAALKKDSAAREELGKKVSEAEELLERVRDKHTAIAENPATAEALEALDDAESAFRVAQIQLQQVATEVQIHGPGGVITDGGEEKELATDGYSTLVASPREFRLGEYRVQVKPAGEVSDADKALEEATEARANAAKAVGVEPGAVDAARQKGRERQELDRELKEAEFQLKSLIGERTVEDLNIEAESLKEKLKERKAAAEDAEKAAVQAWQKLKDTHADGRDLSQTEKLFTTLQEAASESGAGPGAVEDKGLDAAQEFLEDCERLEAQAQQARDDADMGGVLSQEMKLKHEVESLGERHSVAAADLEKKREELSDEALSTGLAESVKAHEELAATLAKEKESYRAGDTAEVLGEQLAGERAHLKNMQGSLKELQIQLAALRAKLGGREGVAEEKTRAEANLSRAEATLAVVQRRADAARLLKDAMEQASAQLRERYSRPLSEAFHALARTIYGENVSFEFDEDLKVSRRIRNGLALDVENLSGGAREQINLLTRLAVASLAARGAGVPIIIDDSLGFSDPERSRDMNLVLSRLGAGHQIIVLTCDQQRFSRVSGAKQLDMGLLKSGSAAD